jgi:uncharacterized membrane protein (UPF0127 family)
MQHRVITGVSSLVLVLLLACGAPPTAVLHGTKGPVSVRLEVARTDAARTKGLMYRRTLADGDGMLFVFDTSAEHAFWMKNTFIPLDLIFIGDDLRVVGIRPQAVPQSTQTISVGVPSRYVLEVPGGWAARHGIAAGTRVDLTGGAGS